jgi:type III pantothenate kinase
MILCIDIGNTNVVMGLFRGDDLITTARYATSNLRTADECGLQAYHFIQRHHPDSRVEVDGVIISSVVPFLTPRMADMSRRYLDRQPIIVSADLDLGIDLMVENPREVGADRLANSVAAMKLYGDTCIVIDLGTATTFDIVTSRGEYLGGVIAPGIETASSNLVKRAAQLFSVEIAPPKKTIGRSTEECMKSGIFWGQVEMINGLIARIEEELQEDCRVVFTGGYGKIFAEHIDRDAVCNPDLSLIGLKTIYDKLA